MAVQGFKREGDSEPESDVGDLKKLKTNEDEEIGLEIKNAASEKGSYQEKPKEMVAQGGQNSTKRGGDDEHESDRGDLKKFKTDEDEEAGQEKKNATTIKSSDQEKLMKLMTGVDQPTTSSSSESSSPQHTPFQMNPHAFDQMALFQLQQQCPFNLGALGNTSQQPQTTQPPNSNSSSQTSHTKLSSPARKGNRKARVRKPRPRKTDIKRTPWSQKEEKLLAETWIKVSEDPRLGVDQEKKTCWIKVLSEYNRHASFKRTKDMLSGKWATLTRACNNFAAIVAQYERLAGENESSWVTRCYKHFQEVWGVAFVHHEAWEVLKGHSKWRDTKAFVPERRVWTDDDVQDLNELFQNDPQPRPLEKPRLSQSKKSDSTPMVGSSSSSREAFKETVHENLQQYHAKKIDLIATQIKLKELKFLTTSIAGLSEEDAKLINKCKEEIRAKYRT